MREASNGQTRLFIQILDFLAIKRRPDPDKFFQRFLAIAPRHREAVVHVTGDQIWRVAEEHRLRTFLTNAPDEVIDAVLDERELESLRRGYRERVTDTDLPHIAELPQTLPNILGGGPGRANRV